MNLLDTHSLIDSWGLIGVMAIIFAETGLLIGFFLPGDTLLFLAGALTVATAGEKHLSLAAVMIGTAVAAVAGAQVGWLIGRRTGPLLFDKPRSRLFNPHNVERAHNLLERYHYGFAIVLARFIPVVRTFMNPACGVAEIPGRTFFKWNLVGGILWTQLIVLLGRALGPTVHIDKYILPVIAAIAVISIAGIAWEAHRGGKRIKAADAEAKRAADEAAAASTERDSSSSAPSATFATGDGAPRD